jgi:hypothetical protein
MSLRVVDDLHGQRPVTPGNGHTGPFRRTGNPLTDMGLSFKPFFVFFDHFSQHNLNPI